MAFAGTSDGQIVADIGQAYANSNQSSFSGTIDPIGAALAARVVDTATQAMNRQYGAFQRVFDVKA